MSASFPTRKIGTVNVSAIGYGAMGIGGAFYGASQNDEERFKVLDRLVELGCTNWDTASPYGDSEELIGKWFKRTGKRDQIFLATKFGFTETHDVRGDPEFVRQEVAKSLQKLQTDHIDLYYQHRPDGNVPIEITVGAMAELVKEGKVKYLGLSEASSATIRRAHKVHPIAAIQIEYSPFELLHEKPGGTIETARELGIAVVAYSPIGRGLLSGHYKSPEDFDKEDFRRFVPKFSAENFPTILKLAEALAEIGKKHNATASQVALAWVLAQGDDIIPIPGSKRIPLVEENLKSVDVKLSVEDVREIRELINATEKIVGSADRYPGAFMAQLLQDTPPLPQ